jgi:hypothetical protein
LSADPADVSRPSAAGGLARYCESFLLFVDKLPRHLGGDFEGSALGDSGLITMSLPLLPSCLRSLDKCSYMLQLNRACIKLF